MDSIKKLGVDITPVYLAIRSFNSKLLEDRQNANGWIQNGNIEDLLQKNHVALDLLDQLSNYSILDQAVVESIHESARLKKSVDEDFLKKNQVEEIRRVNRDMAERLKLISIALREGDSQKAKMLCNAWSPGNNDQRA